MDIGRRDFFKVAAVGSGLALSSCAGVAEAVPRKSLSPNAYGMLYDSAVCVGCKACMSACKIYNDLPPEHSSKEPLWDDPIDLSSKTFNIIKVYRNGKAETQNIETDGFAYVKRQCMHCVDPSCVSACPVRALTKNAETGIVMYNKKNCIGCRYCQVACPFNVPRFEWDSPTPEINKCQLCDHRIEKGGYAACCEFCPTGASIFGRVEDLMKEAKKRLTLKPGDSYMYPVQKVDSSFRTEKIVPQYLKQIYGEHEVGGTQCIMLSAVPFEKIGLPVLPEDSFAGTSEKMQHTLYNKLIAPAVVLGGLVVAVYKNSK